MGFLIIFLSGGCGSVLRYAVGFLLPSSSFPISTLLVNITGSFAIGLLSGLAGRFEWGDGIRLAITVGLCGGFTTFSTFTKDALSLLEDGRWMMFLAYAAGSVLLGLLAVLIGCFLAKSL